jgi:3-hydroxybutyryl-CoA dehydrogenase
MLRTQSMGVLTWPRSAAIVGAGTMGLGVAECWLAAGVRLRLSDATPEATAGERLLARIGGHVQAGLVDAELLERARVVELVSDVSEAVRGADLVFEAVFEDIAVKREVLRAIEAGCPPASPIATNTSSLPIDELAAFLERPQRFLGMHWFNPAEWTPGVEIIPGQASDPALVERVVAFLEAAGKRPIVVGSCPGFVANRIQVAMFREAIRCVEEGIATPEQVDEVVRSCFGFRLPFFGPFQIADMAGLDVYASVFGVLERGLGERFKVPELIGDLVSEGRYGTKTGQGVFAYTQEQRDNLLIERDRRYAALAELLQQIAR